MHRWRGWRCVGGHDFGDPVPVPVREGILKLRVCRRCWATRVDALIRRAVA